MKKYVVQGSMTVEMSFLMPVVLFLMMECILAVFYFHDKNILSGAAYETAVVGSTKMREKEGIKEGELKTLFYQRMNHKCILFVHPHVSVKADHDEIQVVVSDSRKYMKVSVMKRAAVTEPEKKIRDLKCLKEIKED